MFSFYRLDGMIDLRNTPKKLCICLCYFIIFIRLMIKRAFLYTDYVIFLLLSPTAEEH